MAAAVTPQSRQGPGRILIGGYAIFALAASSRATLQLLTKFQEAPAAYLFSGFAAGMYLVITVVLVRGGRTDLRIARWLCWVELTGVLLIGSLSFVAPQWFPDDTVWSRFGSGYGFIPLLMPVLGLGFLGKLSRMTALNPPPSSEN